MSSAVYAVIVANDERDPICFDVSPDETKQRVEERLLGEAMEWGSRGWLVCFSYTPRIYSNRERWYTYNYLEQRLMGIEKKDYRGIKTVRFVVIDRRDFTHQVLLAEAEALR